ncbi:hypothetical protein LIER_14465 [Lithospermum erythrorhizon]|uniref:DUF7769 domain-containing protein n=1 Tax=Lithospermum erythrorhizon TaxID=34254 RepID=A0AAV3Q089_LITER
MADASIRQSPIPSRKRCKNFTNKERLHLYQELLKEFNGRKLNHAAIKKYVELYSLNTKTVASIWKSGSSFIIVGASVDVSNNCTNGVGRKRIELDPEKVKNVDLRCRKTLAGLANALAIAMSQTTVYQKFKEGHLRRHSNAIKPTLTEQNKKGRLEFCISMIEGIFLTGYRLMVKFAGMFDHVVIDEKWFFMTKDAQHYYLTIDEDEPYCSCQSKRFITKVMFLAAVARPRFGGKLWFIKH